MIFSDCFIGWAFFLARICFFDLSHIYIFGAYFFLDDFFAEDFLLIDEGPFFLEIILAFEVEDFLEVLDWLYLCFLKKSSLSSIIDASDFNEDVLFDIPW